MTTFDEAAHPRTSAGVTTGGQFTTKPKGESAVTLAATGIDQRSRDRAALNSMAEMLGVPDHWNGSADYLEEVAELIGSTGRPHPGAVPADRYDAAMNEWRDTHRVRRGEAGYADWSSLNMLARHLGNMDRWSPDELGLVAHTVSISGRPRPGGRDSGATYLQALEDWQDRGAIGDYPPQFAAAEFAGLPVMRHVLHVVYDRDVVDDSEWDDLSADHVSAWYERHVGPAADRMADMVASAPEPADHPWLSDSAQAWRHVRDCAQAAGLPVAGRVLWLRYESGDLNEADLESVTPGLLADAYERHLGPAIDAVEHELGGCHCDDGYAERPVHP